MPLGAARITLLAFQANVVAQGEIWNQLTAADVIETSVPSASPYIVPRAMWQLDFNDGNFYVVSCNTSSRTNQVAERYTYDSVNGLTYQDRYTLIAGTTQGNLTTHCGVNFPSSRKAVMFISGWTYGVVSQNESTKALTISTSKSPTGTYNINAWLGTAVNPADENKFVLFSNNNSGMMFMTFDPASETVTQDAIHTLTNAAANTQRMFVIDDNGVYKIAIAYIDSVTFDLKVFTAKFDGTDQSTTTLDNVGSGNYSTMEASSYSVRQASKQFLYAIKSANSQNILFKRIQWSGTAWSSSSGFVSSSTPAQVVTNDNNNLWSFYCGYSVLSDNTVAYTVMSNNSANTQYTTSVLVATAGDGTNPTIILEQQMAGPGFRDNNVMNIVNETLDENYFVVSAVQSISGTFASHSAIVAKPTA